MLTGASDGGLSLANYMLASLTFRVINARCIDERSGAVGMKDVYEMETSTLSVHEGCFINLVSKREASEGLSHLHGILYHASQN